MIEVMVQYDRNTPFLGPLTITGTIKVTGDVNMKEAVENLSRELDSIDM